MQQQALSHDAQQQQTFMLLLVVRMPTCAAACRLAGRLSCCRYTQVGQPEGVGRHHAAHTHRGPGPVAAQAAATAHHHAAASSSSSSSGSQQRRQPTWCRVQQCCHAAACAGRGAAAIVAADGNDQQQQQCAGLNDWPQEDGVSARLSCQPCCWAETSARCRCR
jgi:hypothetical protein